MCQFVRLAASVPVLSFSLGLCAGVGLCVGVSVVGCVALSHGLRD